jgi:hypothetical protein
MTNEAMSPLRRRMIEDMTIRKFAPKTQHDYGCNSGAGYRNTSGSSLAFAVAISAIAATAASRRPRMVHLPGQSPAARPRRLPQAAQVKRSSMSESRTSLGHRSPLIAVEWLRR